MFSQGAKVKRPQDAKPVSTRISQIREIVDSHEFSAKHEAYRFALANKQRTWARRWLRLNSKSY